MQKHVSYQYDTTHYSYKTCYVSFLAFCTLENAVKKSWNHHIHKISFHMVFYEIVLFCSQPPNHNPFFTSWRWHSGRPMPYVGRTTMKGVRPASAQGPWKDSSGIPRWSLLDASIPGHKNGEPKFFWGLFWMSDCIVTPPFLGIKIILLCAQGAKNVAGATWCRAIFKAWQLLRKTGCQHDEKWLSCLDISAIPRHFVFSPSKKSIFAGDRVVKMLGDQHTPWAMPDDLELEGPWSR